MNNKIRDDFPKDVKEFFKRLENYLDTDLYFFGSVNRSDYIHGKSDIDLIVFTDNEYSVMNKLQHFLHVKRNAFDKLVWKLNGTMIYGYKIKCEKYVNINCEIAIYNNEFKNTIMKEQNQYKTIPLYISILLFILKTMYYTFPILSEKTYSSVKRFLFNDLMVSKKNTIFFLMKQNKH